MARVRSLAAHRRECRFSDASIAVSADSDLPGEATVVPNGKSTYLRVEVNGHVTAFSGERALRALAVAIVKALDSKRPRRKPHA